MIVVWRLSAVNDCSLYDLSRMSECCE